VADIRATLWDFGGVISSSPFEAFRRYEREQGLPDDFLRTLNATNPDTNAWARFERSEVSFEEFCVLYEDEARSAGGELDGREVMACLSGEVRPHMVEAIRRCRARLATGLITNNVAAMDEGPGWRNVVPLDELFDVVIESSKVGYRKPDARIYELACEQLGVEPAEVVFLDDLGVNLKPAAAMGMTTIKVVDADAALAELEAAVGFALR
jgi:putative hydrolase of the HAD superfamily